MSKHAILGLCAAFGLFAACASPVGNEAPSINAAPSGQASTLQNEAETLESLKFDSQADYPNAVVSIGSSAPAASFASSSELVASAESLVEEGKFSAARIALTQALHQWDLSPSQESNVLASLESINSTIFLAASEEGDMATHQVVKGDSLARVATQHQTNWQFLLRINRLESTTIVIGQELLVPKAPFTVVIKKDRYTLDLLQNGGLVKRYQIGTGRRGSTPEGVFQIQQRVEGPADNGDEASSKLGSHWLGLRGSQGFEGYGLHGTPEADVFNLGGEATQGTVALRNADIEELFDILPEGAEVTIVA